MNFDYFLDQNWRWGLMGTYYNFDGSVYEDLEFSVGRMFGDREISLAYSTDTRRVFISLGGFGY